MTQRNQSYYSTCRPALAQQPRRRRADRDEGGEDDGGDGTSEPGPQQEKSRKINESSETALVDFAKTNSETELTGRNDHILVRMPTGLAVACVAGVDQTTIAAVRGQHMDKHASSAYKTNKHTGMKTIKQMIAFARDMNARMGGLGVDPRHLGNVNEAHEFNDSNPLGGLRTSGGQRALTRVWTRGRRRSATSWRA